MPPVPRDSAPRNPVPYDVLPYDAVLCDIDGVLRHWPPADAVEQANGLPVGALAAAAFAPARLHPAITGEVTDEQWRVAVAADLADRYGSAGRARAVVAAWSEFVPAVDQEVVALLGRLRGVASVALVSNATTRLEQDLARQGLDGLTDAVVNTSRIGVAKPDPRVYRIAAERLGAPAARCLFVDDTEANVVAAREAGMTGLHYQHLDDLRHALAPLLDAPGSAPRRP
ncbi:HAD family phosphatase [Streptomyces armeniacus]|uniref:HAD family phosphatase n=1 Tax=Streptomyces armeniacus TaxID=83291 RepID=A0A345XWU5_9ACTN|nr:HAD family phosphatase [Streptomyces armeniacus]AXK36111.1 HAD family phosphatase [Streptomyces armeniacus]